MNGVDLDNCHQEPIGTPGSIQPFGALLVLQPPTYTIRAASANAGEFLPQGPDPASLPGRPLTDWLPCAEALATLERSLEHRTRATTTLAVEPFQGETILHLTAHRQAQGLVVELETTPPAGPAQTRATMDRLHHFLEKMPGWREPDALLTFAAREVHRLTGTARAMVYRFDPDYNGTITAEITDGRPRRYQGQRFPASDIPEQARALYRRNRVRVIPDTGYTPVPLLAEADHVEPFDLGLALLRSVSPIHLEYLHNLDVGATLAISILDEHGDLWGMLVCHHDAPLPLPPEVRDFSAMLGDFLSAHLPLLRLRLEQEAIEAGQDRINAILADLPRADDLVPYLHQQGEALLKAFEAEGMILCLRGECHAMGETPPAEIRTALEATVANPESGEGITATNRAADWIEHPRDPGWVAGVLYVPLANYGNDYLCLLRREQIETIDWAGNPNKAVERNPDTGRLSPRKSFELWQEEVRGQSLPWEEHHLRMAEKLSQLVGLHQGYKVRQALETEARLQHQAHHDALTGLPNRTLLLDRIQQAMERVDRYGHSLGLLFADLDGFKAVNDSLGHEAGDRVLEEVASRLAGELRDCDTVARLGGDEFVILAEAGPPDQASVALTRIAERVIAAVIRPMDSADDPVRLGTSIGIACYGVEDECRPPATADQLLREADAAMYRAKRSGHNGYVFAGGA